MKDDAARTGDKQAAAPATAPPKGTAPTEPRSPWTSAVVRQVGALAGGALLAQATWGTLWFVAVVAAVVVIEGLIVWDLRHPRQG